MSGRITVELFFLLLVLGNPVAGLKAGRLGKVRQMGGILREA
jgi:hypothetical protein